MIKNYHFGKIKINGLEYDHDIEVRWDGTVYNWWRQTGHVFALPDLERALAAEPDAIVFGTGAYGAARVDEALKRKLGEEGIDYHIAKTKEAAGEFNKRLEAGERVIGLFHLTC